MSTWDARRFEIQASQYEFPYHYLLTLGEPGAIAIGKFLDWGLDYPLPGCEITPYVVFSSRGDLIARQV